MLIDIARIPGLSGIREKDGKIEIGAGTVHHDVASSALLRQVCPTMAEARRDRRSAGSQSRHARRQPGARRSVGRLSGGDAGARRRDPDQGPEGLARREGARLLPGPVHRRSGARTKSSPRVQFTPVKAAAYAKLHQRASHFAIVGVAAALDVKRRRDSVGAHRADRRELARDAPDRRGAGAGGKAGVGGQHRGGRAAARARRWRTSTRTSTPARSIGAR